MSLGDISFILTWKLYFYDFFNISYILIKYYNVYIHKGFFSICIEIFTNLFFNAII